MFYHNMIQILWQFMSSFFFLFFLLFCVSYYCKLNSFLVVALYGSREQGSYNSNHGDTGTISDLKLEILYSNKIWYEVSTS